MLTKMIGHRRFLQGKKSDVTDFERKNRRIKRIHTAKSVRVIDQRIKKYQ
jgi:hypothetical protein